MKNTFNVKIVLMLCFLIISLISISAAFIFDIGDFNGKEQLFLPLIIGLLLTLVRFYMNISEKNKIILNLKKTKEDSLDQTKIAFESCPEYWTKVTKDDKIYCQNKFVDKDSKAIFIGGDLSTELNTELETGAQASNIGFKFDVEKETKKNNTESVSMKNPEFTYIPEMRNSLTNDKNANVEEFTVEGFSESETDLIPHKHSWTYVNYAHKGKPVVWKDGVERDHPNDVFNNDKHLEIFNYGIYHTHKNGQLTQKESDELDKLVNNQNDITQSFSNDTNWISPYKEGNNLYTEINLDELNKASNKCQLVKNMPWIEAKAKCENVNVKFKI